MGAWDMSIFAEEANEEFLEELGNLDEAEIVEAIRDACVLAAKQDSPSEEEYLNGLAAATVASIWAGAPFSAGEVADAHPFLRELIGAGDEELREVAGELLENADTQEDLEVYLEALS
ncbi:DUF4259 domain-containing protein [Corynebacterium lowii]|uniref:DUF4259 domain-containing protein n=1 Tax=Corynebacterium lowii TaxID=1544413 RepID=A0A0Q1AKQ3_9CORY|nr:DUF4259 domain-containing protein [Corynebacterium lowii]KQB87544.1 hypothetical protein Clow_00603 [Corynebacterium lowii]MDP9851861.1 hypothetical protein [Corynebacterium lowii]